MLKKIFIALLIILGVFFWYLDSMHAFDPIYFEKSISGGESIIYQNIQGNYAQSGKVMKEIYDTLLAKGITSNIGIGIYYDDPNKIEKDKLRSEVGIVIEDSFKHKLKTTTHNYKIKQTYKGEYLQTEFPYKNMVSIFIGMNKVYPALIKEIDNNSYKHGPCTEIYDMKKKKIYYRMQMH